MADRGDAGPCCCGQPVQDFRMLRFPDGGQAGVVGLGAILGEMAAAGKPVAAGTAEEIVEKLAQRNYVPASAHPQYRDVVLREYAAYIERRGGSGGTGRSPVSRDGRGG